MHGLLSLRLAYRHVTAESRRLALSVIAVALGVSVIVGFQLMNVDVLRGFEDTLDSMAGRTSLSVVAGDGLNFSEDVVDRIAAAPGVELAVPLVSAVAFPDDGSGELLLVRGIDVTHDAAVRLYQARDQTGAVFDDPLVFLNQPDAILVGRELADRRGLKVGGTLPLVTPTGVKTFTVRGLLDAEGLARTIGGRIVVMDLFAAERAFTADRQINQVDVLVAHPETIELARAAIAAVLPPGLRVEEPNSRKDVVRKTIAGVHAITMAFGFLVAFAGFIICYSRVSAVLETRTWEVGLLRAVGLGRLTVFVELLKEALILGLVGSAVGIPLGIVIARVGLPILAQTTALGSRLAVPATSPGIRTEALLFGLAVGALSAIVAAIVPAVRLARTEPVAALGIRGREMPSAMPRVRWRLLAGLFVVTAGLVALHGMTRDKGVGFAATGFMSVLVCALAGPLVVAGGRGLGRLWRGAFGPTGRIAAGHLTRRPRGSGLMVAVLGIGLGAVVMFGMVATSLEHTVQSSLTTTIQADVIVTSPYLSGGYRFAPINESIVTDLAAVPGVRVVGGVQSRDVGYRGESVALKGYEGTLMRPGTPFVLSLAAGALPSALELVDRGEAALVSSSFAYKYGTRPGDVITLESPRGPVEVRVAGVATGQPENAVLLGRARYRELWNDPLVYLVYVGLTPGADRAAVVDAIQRQLGTRYRLQLRTSPEIVDYFTGEVRQAFKFLYFIETFTFIIVLLAMSDTVATAVMERLRELAMMRAVGLSGAHVFGMMMLEGAGIALLGLVLAGCAGLALGLFWVEMQFPSILGWKLDLHVPTGFVVTAVALTYALCLVGSMLPAWRASRLSIPQSLRNE